jgi:cell fate (sporulation/competence/biofilm development) regulator YlbF (YheA/YmcA/DUF963 family)
VTAIIELARRLGKAIAESPQAAALRAARDQLNAQPDLAQTLKDFQQQAAKIARLEGGQQPVEVDDKRRLQELNDKLVADETFKKFTAAQVDYVDLMRKVNTALRTELTETERE